MICQSALSITPELKSLVNCIHYANGHSEWTKSFQKGEGCDSRENDTIIRCANRLALYISCWGCVNAAPVCETASFMHRGATPNLISQSQGNRDLRHDQAHLYYPLTWLHTIKLFLHTHFRH